jgi:hypothetical protein
MLAGLGLSLGVAAAGASAAPHLPLGLGLEPGAKGRSRGPRTAPLASAGIEEWSRQIGTEFMLAGGAVARLAEVRPLRSGGRPPAGVRSRAFEAIFEPAGGKLPAGDRTLEVAHGQAGPMNIYFSACTDGSGTRRLRAIFA